MKNSIATICLLTFPLVSTAEADAIDFKGVPFGASEQEFAEKHPDFRCSDTDARFRFGSDRTCVLFGKPERTHQDPKLPSGTYAGVPANILVKFYEDKLASISVVIFSAHFDSVLTALTERYGKPDLQDNPVVRNRMGAEFQNVKARWTRGDVILDAEKYGATVSEGRISYFATWGIDEFEKRRGQSIKKGAGDL